MEGSRRACSEGVQNKAGVDRKGSREGRRWTFQQKKWRGKKTSHRNPDDSRKRKILRWRIRRMISKPFAERRREGERERGKLAGLVASSCLQTNWRAGCFKAVILSLSLILFGVPSLYLLPFFPPKTTKKAKKNRVLIIRQTRMLQDRKRKMKGISCARCKISSLTQRAQDWNLPWAGLMNEVEV